MQRTVISSLALVALAAPALAGGTTWTVDDNGSADFVFIQDAVDAAAPGDVILIHAGAYPGFTVDGKALTIAPATAAAAIQVASFVDLRNIPFGAQLDVYGLRIGEPFTVGGAPALTLATCDGTVRMTDCTVQGWDPIQNGCPASYYPYGSCGAYPCPDATAREALGCTSCAEVVFLRCTLTGGNGSSHTDNHCGVTSSGASAARIVSSSVSFLECSFSGGFGGDVGGSHCFDGGNGGHGVTLLTGSLLFTDRSTYQGLHGGSPGCEFGCGVFGCASSGARGNDIHVDATSAGTFKDATFAGSIPIGGQGASALVETYTAPYCVGTFEECPCENAGDSVAGCESSAGTGGALLQASGWPSVANDTITLVVSGLNPNQSPPGLFFQGTSRVNGGVGVVLNDGLLCAGGDIIRLKGKISHGGSASFGFGDPADPAVSVRGALPAGGGTRFYQFWYRNQPAMFCPPAQFNMSNGLEIVWQP